MKLNKFVCYCGHEFYDTEAVSKCDSCQRTIVVGVKPVTVDIHLLESEVADKSAIREAVSRSFEDSITRKT